MTKDWVKGVGHSPVCQILLQIAVRAEIFPLHLLGPVLLGCCQLQLISLSSMVVLQPPLLCEGWGGHPLCLSWDSSVLMDLYWPCDCTAYSSIPSIGSVSLVLLLGIFLKVQVHTVPTPISAGTTERRDRKGRLLAKTAIFLTHTMSTPISAGSKENDREKKNS